MMYFTPKKGFTLIEMMVTVSILAILVTTVVVSFGPAREQARDAQRQTDLRTIEAALALYKNKYGVYPEGCNGATTIKNNIRFSGQPDTDYRCPGNSAQYIVGLAPEFMQKLPMDPRLNGENSGYVYAVNDERSVYKIMALNTVETEPVQISDEFSRCDSSWTLPLDPAGSPGDGALCRRTPNTRSSTRLTNQNDPTTVCQTAASYQTSYAISAGFSSDSTGANTNFPELGQEYDTEIVRCG